MTGIDQPQRDLVTFERKQAVGDADLAAGARQIEQRAADIAPFGLHDDVLEMRVPRCDAPVLRPGIVLMRTRIGTLLHGGLVGCVNTP